jgi:hypothetical protein
MKRHTVLLMAVAFLVLAALACGSNGGSAYSFSTSRTSSGNSGHVEITGDANGTVTDETEIDEDFPGATVDIEVAAGVLEGSYTVDFLDDDGSVVFSLDVKPGALAKGSGTVTLNDEGEVEYALDASDAKGVKLVIDYDLR